MYKIFDNNKPVESYGYPGWDKGEWDCFDCALVYAQHWLDFPLSLAVGVPKDYSGYGDIIEIRRVS